MADRHAGTAQARADEAYGVGNNALGVGNGAMTSAQQANMKADQNANDVTSLKRKVAYLEWKGEPAPQEAPLSPPHGDAGTDQAQQQLANEKPRDVNRGVCSFGESRRNYFNVAMSMTKRYFTSLLSMRA